MFPEVVEAAPVPVKVHFPDAADALDLNPTPPTSTHPASPALALDGVPSPAALPPASPRASPSPPLSPLLFISLGRFAYLLTRRDAQGRTETSNLTVMS